MGLAEDFDQELHSIETRFNGGLSNTSTKKFDELIKIVSEISGIDEDKIYITAATSRASNLWNRLAQGKPLTQHFSFALGIIDAEDLQGGISPASKFIGPGVGHYDAIALAVKRGSRWVIGAVLDTDVLPLYDKISIAFPGVDITHEESAGYEDESDEVLFAWYVGTTGSDEYGEWHDYSDEYIDKGIWQNGWNDKFIDVVNSIQVGDRIAIKSCFTQKNNLPFNNNGKIVGAMRIKAIGTVIANDNDGKQIQVDWTRLDPVKTWFGPGTLRETIHGVDANDGYIKKQLLDFTFADAEQDYTICEERYSDELDDVIDEIGKDGVLPLVDSIDESKRLSIGSNVLLYGVPGSGKSWTIEHEYCHSDSVVERLVFHPDYTNADFIGQILPVVDEDKQVTYEFTPGPFTSIMREAYWHPDKEYILIIEEINRGNAPAIFGEVFQLLDRKVALTDSDDEMPVGTSEYGITHKYMAEEIYHDETHKVKIPSNLSILGTMNTSDQNVFTLDTAFQRRWRMRLIENNFDNVRTSLSDAKILDTEVTWKKFCDTVNGIIVGNKAKMASAEDKRLGVYFIHENDIAFDNRALPTGDYISLRDEYNDLLIHETAGDITDDQKKRLSEIREAVMHNRIFPEKVIKYLWDDAFKFNPEALFDTDNMDSLEKVIRTFVYSRAAERFKVFKQTVRDSLYPSQQ
ncbi:McrB family protein [Butyrivibrio sp. WCD2001]|uniref:McrB family protein n=1 Tax=Butyrivibrio sp. WCD2001 TaxID=1280681 RepID=UPI00041BBB43|nr:AAA family ATPase [Butyrivibrio sp. WCD2001]